MIKSEKAKKLLLYCLPVIFLLLGLVAVFGKVFVNHFHFFYSDEADGMLHIYILEHNYLFLRHQFPHLNLFSPPFYYPNANVLFYSDPFISITPIYAFFRLFFNESVSFNSLLITTMVLNYILTFFLFKNKFKLNIFASSVGAYLFAFSVFNYIQVTHEHHTQLIFTFFILLSLYSLLSLDKRNSTAKNVFWANMFYLNIVLSVYSSYAITWYYCFALFVIFISMLMFKKTRKRLKLFLNRFGILLTVNIIPALLLLAPLAYKYSQLNNFHWAFYFTPYIDEFFANYSIFNYPFKRFNYTNVIELNSGVEYLTLIFGLIGLRFFKTYRKAIYTCLLILFLLTIKIYNFSLWEYVYSYFPGANGMRTNHRILILFHFFMATGCALFINNFISRKANSIKIKVAVSILAIVLCIGQIGYPNSYGYNYINLYDAVNNEVMDIEKYSKQIKDNNCKIVYFSFDFTREQIDTLGIDSAYTTKAMWIANKNKVYIMNGYSGYTPSQFDRELTEEEKASLCILKVNYNK